MWVKMASLLWMLLTVPENSRISVDSSTTSAGRSLQSIASCELSTLEQREGHSSDQGKVVIPKARRGWQHSATGTGLYPPDVPSRDEGAAPVVHPSKMCHSRNWATTEKAPGLPWDARRKGWELGCASCPISPVHIIFK